MPKILCGWIALMTCSIAGAQDGQVRKVLAKFAAMRPGEKKLAMYRLDWEDSLETAQQRALDEGRPICLVIIHAKYGDISAGHC